MFDVIKSVTGVIFNYDSNITDYEKMENRYKIGRKKLIFLILIITFLIILNSSISYLTYIKYSNHIHLLLILATVTLIPLAFFFKKKPKKFTLALVYLFMPILFTIIVITVYHEGLSLSNFILSIMIIMFMILIYSSAYLFIKDKLSIGEVVRLTFVLSGEDNLIEAELISITKTGDYIVCPVGSEEEEILINKAFVMKIIYNKSNTKN